MTRAALVLLALAACGQDPAPSSPRAPGDAPTWSEHVGPLVMESCTGCHIAGGIAPFALTSYAEAREYGGLMKHATATRQMPPFNPDNSGACNTYRDARWLTDEEIALVGAWVDAGMPEGEPRALTPAMPLALDRVDLTLDPGAEYTPRETVSDDYHCFVIEPGTDRERYITGFAVTPGDARVVHHVIVYGVENDQQEATVAALDAAEPGPGYTCYGGTGAGGDLKVGWAPGGGATLLPQGTGLKLAANRPVVMQIHYNTAGGAFPDRTTVQLRLEDAVEAEATVFPIAAPGLNLPPGRALVTETATFDNPVPSRVWGVFPHMHNLGRTLRVDASEAGCLVDVPRWDFHWQGFHFYEEPLLVNWGETVTITCGYDTRGRDETVYWGEGTDDEMCLNYVYVTFR